MSVTAQRQVTLAAAELDVRAARLEFDDAQGWLRQVRSAGLTEPLAAEAWVFDEALEHVVLVRHRWRGWVCPGGRVEDGEPPRTAAGRELHEESGLAPTLQQVPAAAFVRAYRSDWTPTLGLAYAAITPRDSELTAEPGQPVRWVPLHEGWDGAFPEDVERIREYAASSRL